MQWWACDTIVPTICGMMNSSTQKDAWHFTDNRVVRAACQFGYWLPSDPEAAPVPTAEQCMSTIATMKDYAQKASTWYAATINLNAYPGPELTNALVQCELPSGSGTGKPYVYMI